MAIGSEVMATTFNLRCPGCRDAFPWNKGVDWPRFCPLCGYDTSIDHMPEVAAPALKTAAITKAADATYRAMEEGSIHRAKVAAEMLGVPEHEMSDLKITNLKDNQREGDVAAIETANAVSTMIQSHPQMFGHQSTPQAVQQAMGYAAAAHDGPDAYAGSKAQSFIKQIHGRTGNISTDVPALEIVQRNKMMGAANRGRRR